ncbi:uncharacterized protein F4822DRAFT_66847 [Hypoxylon trugodes]|uniref:uncharacterized protein n=1 Tax=Hypoxylon trugodes TaxID=326681 RepID=UPI00219D79D2|nr:uncharacterized protein F4822DRAFT_66847 [Hypoxylon trugodes]KAI1384333.1 hypothetical protein F4822DRAFT_66847 [Hypoxylon trugodes]
MSKSASTKKSQPSGGQKSAVYQPRETDVKDYPHGIFELLSSWTVGDSDAKWGPFAKHVRAAKQEKRWVEWSIYDIARAQPDDVIDYDEVEERDARRRRSSRRRKRSVNYRINEELLHDIRPAQIDFQEYLGTEYHPGEYYDNFFKAHYGRLYGTTVKFVDKWFNGGVHLGNLKGEDPSQNTIWTTPLTEQFIEYAKRVAYEDRGNGGWPVILNDNVQRKWLIVGILGQIMEKKVFTELLFGADDTVKDELERFDAMWVEEEGYGRKSARANIARWAVKGRLLPLNFWLDVDSLTAATLKVFLPLLNALKEVFPNRADYRLDVFLQELHSLISYAGMIQVCTAVSPTIFHFLSATPGARMDTQTESQADVSLYRESKELHDSDNKQWEEYVDAAMKGGRVKAYTNETILVPKDDREKKVMEHQRLRGAKVKMAVFPGLTRYTPKNKGLGDPDPEAPESYDMYYPTRMDPDPNMEGQNITVISNCQVVYYQGLMYAPENVVQAISLEDHISYLPRDSNGLLGLIGKLILLGLKFSRLLFWHIAVNGFFFGLIGSMYLGRDFVWYLISTWHVVLVFTSFLLYLNTKHYNYSETQRWRIFVVFGIALATLYAWGLYATVTDQVDQLPRGPLLSNILSLNTGILSRATPSELPPGAEERILSIKNM